MRLYPYILQLRILRVGCNAPCQSLLLQFRVYHFGWLQGSCNFSEELGVSNVCAIYTYISNTFAPNKFYSTSLLHHAPFALESI